jgi:hypothetical protein
MEAVLGSMYCIYTVHKKHRISCPSVDHSQSRVHSIAFRTVSSQGYPGKKVPSRQGVISPPRPRLCL